MCECDLWLIHSSCYIFVYKCTRCYIAIIVFSYICFEVLCLEYLCEPSCDTREVKLLYLSELFMGIVLCQIIMLVSFYWVFFGQCLCPKYPYLVAMVDAKDASSNIKSFLWQNFHMWQF